MTILNTYSLPEVAFRLGVSRARVDRVALRLGIGATPGAQRRLTEEEVATLVGELGATPPVDGLSRSESLVLAELARRPNGMASRRAVGRVVSLAPATASKAVDGLVSKGLAIEEDVIVAHGRAVQIRRVRANTADPRWPDLSSQLGGVRPPHLPEVRSDGLPQHLRHAFWNIDDEAFDQLRVVGDGVYIATRALTTWDPELVAFAVTHLRAPAWESAAEVRGLTPADRRSANNFAGTAPA
ncbi:hypothetical protein BH23ACT9_BH23ACT9_00460 [soil metagenome]